MTDRNIMRSPEEFRREARERAYKHECEFHGCSQAVLHTFQELLDLMEAEGRIWTAYEAA